MDAIETTRKTVTLFFLGLPLIMISIIGFLAVSILNTGMLILFAGQIVAVPVAVMFLHLATWPLVQVKASDLGMLVPSFEAVLENEYFNVSPSYWVAHIVFLFSYIFTNALTVYRKEASVSTSTYSWKVENRKARSAMIMTVSLILMISLIGLRYFVVGTETFLGILIALVTFFPLGYGWYQLAIKSGAQQGDVFGIVQQMIPIMEDDTNATLCMPA